MKKITITLLAGLALSTLSINAYSEPVTAGGAWSDSAGFQSAYEKVGKDNRADMIKKAEGGYYDGFNTYNSYITNTAIGAQTNITESFLLNSNVFATNCGNTSAQLQSDSSSTNENEVEADLECETAVGAGGHNDN